MGGSLVRSLLIVTESGINVYEHHMGESQLTSSQLISGMYTAFFTFFESEMSKGSVRSIELSRTKIIVFSYLDLNIIIEFERYCEEFAISILTEKTKSLIAGIVPEKKINPNRYIELIDRSDLSIIFGPAWQHTALGSQKIENLLSHFCIFLQSDKESQLLHCPEEFGSSVEFSGSVEEFDHKDDQRYYKVNLSIGTDLEFIIISSLRQKSKILSHLRLITEFLSIIQPASEMDLPYYLPYFQQVESNADFQQLLITYGWILPEMIETLLIKRKLHLIGTDQSTKLLDDILETLGLQGFFSISPFFNMELPEASEDYDIIRSADISPIDYPVINLYTNKTSHLITKSTIRSKMLDGSSPDKMLQIMQEYFVELEAIHHDIFEMIFQIDSEKAAEAISRYRKGVERSTWLLALQYFVLKTPFLTQQLHSAVGHSVNHQPFLGGDLDYLSKSKDAILNTLKVMAINGVAIILLLAFFFMLFSIFDS